MYYEFYVDVFFAENLILDYVILLLTGFVTGSRIRFWRILLAAATGAAGNCVLMITPMRNKWITLVVGYAGIGMGILKLGLENTRGKLLIQKGMAFYGIAFFYGGMLQLFYAYTKFSLIPLGILSGALATLYLMFYQREKRSTDLLCPVLLTHNGKTVRLVGFWDTGNQLFEPVTGKPVCIVSKEAIETLLDRDARMLWIPYHSVGKEKGWLMGVTLDELSMEYENHLWRIKRPIIAISNITVSGNGSYQMLLHPSLLQQSKGGNQNGI